MPIPDSIRSFVDDLTDRAPADYGDLKAVVFNGSLKRSPEPSHTDGLIAVGTHVLERVGVKVDVIRTADHEIPPQCHREAWPVDRRPAR